jgi:uncharacterized protein RhaS with RHS repeats
MKSNTKRQIIILVAAFIGMVEAAHAFYDPGLQRWINRDPIGETGGWNLYRFVQNNPATFVDLFGLMFVYQGPYKDDYKRFIECWKDKLPKDSLLREKIKELEESPRDIRIKANTLKDAKDKPTRPFTFKDPVDIGKGRDTTTYIDPKSYTIGKRTWTFPEALAHELLHASYYQDPNRGSDHHLEDTWDEDEKKVTKDARDVPCK